MNTTYKIKKIKTQNEYTQYGAYSKSFIPSIKCTKNVKKKRF